MSSKGNNTSSAMLEVETKKVSAAFQIDDAVHPGENIQGAVNIALENVAQKPLIHTDGYLLFLDVPSGTYNVQVEAEYYDFNAGLSLDTSSHNPLSAPEILDLTPSALYPFEENASLLRGQINDSNGNPLPGVRVEVQGSGEYAITDSSGRMVLEFDIGSSTPLALDVTKDGYTAAVVNETATPNTAVSFTQSLSLVPNSGIALVTGTLKNTVGDPIAGASVEAVAQSQTVRTHSDGTFVFPLAIAGATADVDFSVVAPGYIAKTQNFTVTKDQTTNVEIALNNEANTASASLFVEAENLDTGAALDAVQINVPLKNYTGLTNTAGFAAAYFDLLQGSEEVTVIFSKAGFYSVTRNIKLSNAGIGSLKIKLRPE